MTSSEFERFLAERAAAAENVGNVADGNSRGQQRQKKEEDASLFAL